MDTHSQSPIPQITTSALIKRSFLNTHKYFWQVISDISFPVFLTIAVLVPISGIYIRAFGEKHPIVMLFELVADATIGVLILCLLGFYLHKRVFPKAQLPPTFWAFSKEITLPWTLESLKASFFIMLGFIVFLIPGFLKFVHYIFVSFIVFFNSEYRAGQLQALKHSQELSFGIGWFLFFLMFILPYVLNFLSNVVVNFIFGGMSFSGALYLLVTLKMCIGSLITFYILSVLYFIYVIKDNKHIVGYESARI